MAEVMKLQDILSDLNSVSREGTTKTASAKAPSASNAKAELVAALNAAHTPQTTKVASAADSASVTDRLVKIAGDLAQSDGESLLKEAHLYGAGVADGFMARLSQYEQVAPRYSTKIASTGDVEADFEKFASENPELTKQAVELGYLHGKIQIEQEKVASFQQGYRDAAAQIEALSKTAAGQKKLAQIAAHVERQEQVKTAEAIDAWVHNDPSAQEKLAAVNMGYSDACGEINKIASDTFERGYRDTINLLRAM